MSNTNITEKKEPGIKALLNSDRYKREFEMALPRHLSSERFIRISNTALTRNPKLLECTPASFMKCLLDLSAMGLEPDGKKAHLIPYRDNRNNVTECTLIVDYKGKVELVRRDPSVEDVQCITICENDICKWVNNTMHHEIDPKTDRGEVVSTYTWIKWKSGSVSVGEPFSKKDAENAKRSSKTSSSGPWRDHYTEMWKKSNIHRDAKMWPLSPEVQEALSREDSHFSEEPRQATGRVVEGTQAKLSNPYEDAPAAFDDLPPVDPQPTGEAPLESPVEVSEETERQQLIDEIKDTCAENEITLATFGGKVKACGLMAATASLRDVNIETLRKIHDARLAIACGTYQAGGGQ